MKRELVSMLKITWESLFNATAEEAVERVYNDNEFLIGTLQDLGCTIMAENVEAHSTVKRMYDEWEQKWNEYKLEYFNVTIEFQAENERKLDNFIQLVYNMDYDIKVER